MIYTENTKKALLFAAKAHRDQYDKSGLPYLLHPFYLATKMDTEEEVIVALLHDVVEDSIYPLSDLAKEGFSEEVLKAVELLAKSEEVDYLEYVKKIKNNPLAKKVKLADSAHNSDTNRLDNITESDLSKVEKYNKAIDILND